MTIALIEGFLVHLLQYQFVESILSCSPYSILVHVFGLAVQLLNEQTEKGKLGSCIIMYLSSNNKRSTLA